MQVSVKYFASLRELMGESGTRFEFEQALTVNELWQALSQQKNISLEKVMMAVNAEYVKSDYQLREGDEVAYFPPVTGG